MSGSEQDPHALEYFIQPNLSLTDSPLRRTHRRSSKEFRYLIMQTAGEQSSLHDHWIILSLGMMHRSTAHWPDRFCWSAHSDFTFLPSCETCTYNYDTDVHAVSRWVVSKSPDETFWYFTFTYAQYRWVCVRIRGSFDVQYTTGIALSEESKHRMHRRILGYLQRHTASSVNVDRIDTQTKLETTQWKRDRHYDHNS